MPPHDFTFHIDASSSAKSLISTKKLAIGSNFVEVFGKRYEFSDVYCLSDVCSYTVSGDEDRILVWIENELAVTVPVERKIYLHSEII